MNSTTTDFAYSLRRFVAVLFMLFLLGLMALGYFKGSAQAGSLNFSPTVREAAPASASEVQRLAWLNACGLPGHVGAHRPEHTHCQPSVVWSLPDFAEQLVRLQVLNDGETLLAESGAAEARCPFVVLGVDETFQGRLCLSAKGGIYREAASLETAPREWSYTTAGEWALNQPRLAMAEP